MHCIQSFNAVPLRIINGIIPRNPRSSNELMMTKSIAALYIHISKGWPKVWNRINIFFLVELLEKN
jgi:hypothetical protein